MFTADELKHLLNRKERYNVLEYRNKVLMSLLIYQALKPDEVGSITLDDISLKEATLYLKGNRKTNSRTLTLKPPQIFLFHKYQTEIRAKLLKCQINDFFIIGHRGTPMKGEDITKHVNRSFKDFYAPRKVNCQTIRQA